MERLGVHWHLRSFWAEVGSQTVQYLGRILSLDHQAKQCNPLLGWFLNYGAPFSLTCQHNLDTIIQICAYVPRSPISLGKSGGYTYYPTRTLPSYTDAKKRDILSLVGLLQHAAKVIHCGRAFVSCMYATAAKVKELHFYTILNVEFRSDLC